MVLYALFASLFTLGCSDWFRLETTRHRRSADKRLNLDCEYILKSMEGKIEDNGLHGTTDVMRRRECSIGRAKSWMKIGKFFGTMGVWIKRQFEIPTSTISGSGSASTEKAPSILKRQARRASRFRGRNLKRRQNRRATQTRSITRNTAASPDNRNVERPQPTRKDPPESAMKKGRMSDGLGMPRLLRRCTDNSRLLAWSSGLWCAPELDRKYDSMCFKTSARIIVSETKPRLKVNAKRNNSGRSCLGSGTGSEILRSW